jgi:hypothetical protein
MGNQSWLSLTNKPRNEYQPKKTPTRTKTTPRSRLFLSFKTPSMMSTTPTMMPHRDNSGKSSFPTANKSIVRVYTSASDYTRNFAWMATSRPARSSAMRSTPRSMRGSPALARPGHCFQPQPFTRSGCPPPLTQPTRAASQAAPWGVPPGRARICASRRSRDVRGLCMRSLWGLCCGLAKM